MYAALRDHDPVHRVEDNGDGQDYYVLSRFEDIFAAGVDGELFTSTNGITPSYNDMALHKGRELPIVMMDGPEHIELRKTILERFKPARLEPLQHELRAFIVKCLEQFRSDGGGDLIVDLCKPLPSLFVSRMLGVPTEDRRLFDDWAWKVASASATGELMAAGDAVMEMIDYFSKLLEARRSNPEDDLISDLAQARPDSGTPLSDEKILGVCFTMVLGGNDTATGLLGAAAEYLSTFPEQRTELLNDPSMSKGAIEEFLRLASPVQGLARTATRDITLHGTVIPAGRKVLLLYGSGNRDPRRFGADAEQCDIRRNARPHLTFSSGAHMCIGAAAARLQGQLFVEELLARCPRFDVDVEHGEFAEGNFVRRYDRLPFLVEKQ